MRSGRINKRKGACCCRWCTPKQILRNEETKMEYGLNEKEHEIIDSQLKGNNKMDESDHWQEKSRERVNKTIRQGNYKHREYRGGLSRENMDVLEKAKILFSRERKDLNGSHT